MRHIMKRTMKRTIAAATLAMAVSTPALANYGYGVVPGVGEFIRQMQQDVEPAPVANPAQDYCNAVAGYAETAATSRDGGVPLSWSLAIAAGEDSTSRVSRDLIYITAFVYTEPHLAPATEAGLAFQMCWDTYGEPAEGGWSSIYEEIDAQPA